MENKIFKFKIDAALEIDLSLTKMILAKPQKCELSVALVYEVAAEALKKFRLKTAVISRDRVQVSLSRAERTALVLLLELAEDENKSATNGWSYNVLNNFFND